jgi:hypothetical protein
MTSPICYIKGNASKYMKEPAPIPFDAYKGKLKFTGSAVDSLEVKGSPLTFNPCIK